MHTKKTIVQCLLHRNMLRISDVGSGAMQWNKLLWGRQKQLLFVTSNQ